jgi:hypothetical protein
MELGKPQTLSDYPHYWALCFVGIFILAYVGFREMAVAIWTLFKKVKKEATWTPEQRRLMKLAGVTKDGKR